MSSRILFVAVAVAVAVVISHRQYWSSTGMGNHARKQTQSYPPATSKTGDAKNELDAGAPEEIELQPAFLSIFDSAGTRDFENKYSSVVMVTRHDPLESAECSGMIIGPRLVLTAGHCVCSPQGKGRIKCAEQAHAIQIVYGTVRTNSIADIQIRAYAGWVRPHPKLELLSAEDGSALVANNDLAVLFLEETVEGSYSDVELASQEVDLNENLVMVGYGYDKNVGSVYGARYFRKNKVTKLEAPSSGKFGYEQQGHYLYNGFDGGACFRESDGKRWLVGIASVGSNDKLLLTSTVTHRKWIDSEVQRSLKK